MGPAAPRCGRPAYDGLAPGAHQAPDGVHFPTATSSDGRKNNRKLSFTDIEDVEIEDGRIFLETEEQNWEFGAPVDLLEKVEQHIKANRKKDG